MELGKRNPKSGLDFLYDEGLWRYGALGFWDKDGEFGMFSGKFNKLIHRNSISHIPTSSVHSS